MVPEVCFLNLSFHPPCKRAWTGSEGCDEVGKPEHVIRVVKVIHRYGIAAISCILAIPLEPHAREAAA